MKFYLEWDLRFQGLDDFMFTGKVYIEFEYLYDFMQTGIDYLAGTFYLGRLGKFISSGSQDFRADFMSTGKVYLEDFRQEKKWDIWKKNLRNIPSGKNSLVGYFKIIGIFREGNKVQWDKKILCYVEWDLKYFSMSPYHA